jgi:hypothetical protein
MIGFLLTTERDFMRIPETPGYRLDTRMFCPSPDGTTLHHAHPLYPLHHFSKITNKFTNHPHNWQN